MDDVPKPGRQLLRRVWLYTVTPLYLINVLGPAQPVRSGRRDPETRVQRTISVPAPINTTLSRHSTLVADKLTPVLREFSKIAYQMLRPIQFFVNNPSPNVSTFVDFSSRVPQRPVFLWTLRVQKPSKQTDDSRRIELTAVEFAIRPLPREMFHEVTTFSRNARIC